MAGISKGFLRPKAGPWAPDRLKASFPEMEQNVTNPIETGLPIVPPVQRCVPPKLIPEGGEWWAAVQTIASLIGREGVEADQESYIRTELKDKGFSSQVVGQAMDFIDKAALSGHLMESLGMIYQAEGEYTSVRVEHPMERACLPESLWRTIDGCRRKGILDPDLAERLLEGVRTMDTRDWDEEDVETFLSDVLAVSVPGLIGRVAGGSSSGYSVTRILNGKSPEFYS